MMARRAHGFGGKRDVLKLIGNSISHRFVIIKARLVLLFVLCAAIMATAMLTWKFSLRATDNSFDRMSAQLREDVTKSVMAELKVVLLGVSTTCTSVYRALDGVGAGYTRADYASTVLPLTWSSFSINPDADGIMILSAEGLMGGYRRDGPEASILGSQVAIAVPSLENDTLSLAYGYKPDPVNGRPLLNGPMVKMCAFGSCPQVMDPAVYIPPSIAPLSSPMWLIGQTLAANRAFLSMMISPSHQPGLSALRSIKDESGKQKAVVAVGATATRLQSFLQSTSLVQHFHGCMFITEGRNMHLLSATSGSLYDGASLVGGWSSPASALNSTDNLTRKTARYMEAHYGDQLFSRRIATHARLGSHGAHYIDSIPLEFEGLKLLLMLAVPRNDFRGDIDDSRKQGLLFTMAVVIVVFVAGGLAMCVSTTGVSRKLSNQEKDLGEAAAANKALMEQLQGLTQVYPQDWPQVDMGTPLEKLTSIIKALRPGRVLSPSQVRQMQALVTADDIHKPHFLATMRSGSLDRGQAGPSAVQVDSETGNWIGLLAAGRRSLGPEVRRESPANPGSPGSPGSNSNHLTWRAWRKDLFNLDIVRSPSMTQYYGDVNPVHRTSSLRGVATLGGGEGVPRGGASPWQGSDMSNTDTGSIRYLRLLAHPTAPMEKHALMALRSMVLAAIPVTDSSTSCEADSPVHARGLPAKELARLGSRPILEAYDGDDEAAVRPGPHNPAGSTALTHFSNLGREVATSEAGRDAILATRGVSFHVSSMSEEHRQQVDVLRRLGDWNFDTLALEAVALDKALPLVGYSLFLRTGLVHEFGISEHKLANFLLHIARGMETHPYHNAAHVSDVCASFFHLLTQSGLGDHLRSIDKLAALVAALVHDYKHPGVNNDFLSRMRDDLATIYNDHSPLENYHLAEAFQLLYSNEDCNFLDVLSEDDFMELRHIIIEMVLASDLKRHFGVLDAFKARVSQGTPWDVERDSDRLLLLQLALKAADIGHAAKPPSLHKEWARRATEEFYNQGDAERALSLEVSPFMDRMNNNVPRSQLGFFQFLVTPLFESWVKEFPKSSHLLSHMMANIEHWKQELQAGMLTNLGA